MDLKDLTPNLDDVVIDIKHPVTGEVLKNDDDTDMTITILAPHSKEYKKFQHAQISKRLQKAQKSKSQDVDYSDIEEATLEVLANTTKAWNLTFDGENPELTVERAKKMYDEVFWIRNQVEEAAAESMDFMKG